MPKRLCPFEASEQFMKKQISSKTKVRGIKSESSEKTLQLLYRGASKQLHSRKNNECEIANYNCYMCTASMNYITKCFYCDNFICTNCANTCKKCDEDFCNNCSFPNYNESTAVCYSCY